MKTVEQLKQIKIRLAKTFYALGNRKRIIILNEIYKFHWDKHVKSINNSMLLHFLIHFS